MPRKTPVYERVLCLPRPLRQVVLETSQSPPAFVPPGSDEAKQTARPQQDDNIQRWQLALQTAWGQWHAELQRLRQALPRLAAELALFVLEETLGRGIPLAPEVWQRRMEELTAALDSAQGVTLAVHPEDYRWWHSDAAAPLRSVIAAWKLVADPQLRPGEYRVEWGELTLWWRWQERLAALRQVVLERMEADALE